MGGRCVYGNMGMGAYGGQKRTPEALELELKVAVSYLM